MSVLCVSDLNLINFILSYFNLNKPLLVDNYCLDWKCTKYWNNYNYFISLCGNRTVPIEIGSMYTDKNWTQKLMTIKSFVNKLLPPARYILLKKQAARFFLRASSYLSHPLQQIDLLNRYAMKP